ncbi:hypothetical protein [Streptomyces sp. NPDC001851]|uniref:hypothetical protein n=1 Tax=Streptomyces sp. NPDC001851 TaxID=3154529 RepID=UPI0033247A2E
MAGAPLPLAVGVGTGDGAEAEGLVGVGVGGVVVREVGAGGGSAVDRAGSGVACGVRAAGVGAADGGGDVRRCVGSLVGAPGGRLVAVGAVGVGVGAVGVGVGLGAAVPVCVDPAVPDVSGAGEGDRGGFGVGSDRFPEADGWGLGVPPFGIASHTPRPPSTSTAAPAAIHGALLEGRR